MFLDSNLKNQKFQKTSLLPEFYKNFRGISRRLEPFEPSEKSLDLFWGLISVHLFGQPGGF